LRDLSGEHRREISVLSAAAREGVPTELLALASRVPAMILSERLARTLEDNLGMGEAAARWAVTAWASALGLDGFAAPLPNVDQQDSAATITQVPQDEDRTPTAASMVERDRYLSPQRPVGNDLSADAMHASPDRISVLTGLGHLGTLAFSPQGRILAVRTFRSGGGGDDGKLTLWDVADPRQPMRAATLTHDSKSLYAMAFSTDGHTLATIANAVAAHSGTELILWDVTNLASPTRVCVVATGPHVRTVVFSPDGRTMVTAGDEIILWHLTELSRSRFRKSKAPAPVSNIRLSYVGAAQFSPDGRTLATASGTTNGAVILWNIAEPAQPSRLVILPGPFEYPRTVTFSPDGRILVTTDHTHGGRVALWDVRDAAFSPTLIASLTDLAKQEQAAAISPDGHTLATASGGTKDSVLTPGGVILWDITKSAQPNRITEISALARVGTMAFSPDGRILATSGGVDGSVILWKIDGSPQVMGRRQGSAKLPRFDGLYVAPAKGYNAYLRFHESGQVLAVSSTGTAQQVATWLVPSQTGISCGKYEMQGQEISFVAVSESGRVSYTGQINDDASMIYLNSHSFINGHEAEERYNFVAI